MSETKQGQTLATAGDLCGRCGRTINVKEPIWRGFGGSLICNGCHDAGYGGAPVIRPPIPPADMVTSVLLRRAAQLLYGYRAADPTGEIDIIARELQARAELLQTQLEFWRENVSRGGPISVLRAIGEVRS